MLATINSTPSYTGPLPERFATTLKELGVGGVAALNYPPYTAYLFEHYPLDLFVACSYNSNIVVDLDGLAVKLFSKLPDEEIRNRVDSINSSSLRLEHRCIFARDSQHLEHIRRQAALKLSKTVNPDDEENNCHRLATYQYNAGMRCDAILAYLIPSYRHLLDLLAYPDGTHVYLTGTNKEELAKAIAALKTIAGLVIPPDTLAVYTQLGYSF